MGLLLYLRATSFGILGKIYLYYKSDTNSKKQWVRLVGLSTANNPLGLFQKCPLNPVLNSGCETGLFKYNSRIAALVIRHANEHNTVQYAPDGINFDVAASVSLMPIAPDPSVPDAFIDTSNGKGITWRLCHFTTSGTQDKQHSILARFDSDLSLEYDDPAMRDTEHFWTPDIYFRSGLSAESRAVREQQAKNDLAEG